MPPNDSDLHDMAIDHERTKARVAILEASQTEIKSDINLMRLDIRATNDKLDTINTSLSTVVTGSLDSMPKWGMEAQERSNRTVNILVAFGSAMFGAVVMLGIALIQAGHL